MLQKKIKITFILPSLCAGGAERVLSFVACNLDHELFDVTLVVLGFEKDTVYPTNGITVKYLNKSRVLTGITPLSAYLIKQKPQIVVSCMDHVTIPVAFILHALPKTYLITRQANIKRVSDEFQDHEDSWFHKKMIAKAHHRTHTFICQSEDMAEEMEHYYTIDKSKIVIINNPISDGFSLKNPTQKREALSFITVGRLHAEKGHKRILNLLSKLKFPFNYTIIGTGEEKDALVALVKKLGLKSNVTFIPYSDKIADYLSDSDVFLQGSYAEGFPNALLESCAVGTPVIAFSAPGGTGEIIQHGINGYLAADEKEYAFYLNSIFKKNDFQPAKVRDSVYKKFNPVSIIKKYENLFLNVVNTNQIL